VIVQEAHRDAAIRRLDAVLDLESRDLRLVVGVVNVDIHYEEPTFWEQRGLKLFEAALKRVTQSHCVRS